MNTGDKWNLYISKEKKQIPIKIDTNYSFVEGENKDIVKAWSPREKLIINKINEIIDYLKSKGE